MAQKTYRTNEGRKRQMYAKFGHALKDGEGEEHMEAVEQLAERLWRQYWALQGSAASDFSRATARDRFIWLNVAREALAWKKEEEPREVQG